MNKQYIFISGGTASGKSTLASKLHETLNSNSVHIPMDMFYPEVDLVNYEISSFDFDKPEALDNKLFIEKLLELYHNNETLIPLHDFETTSVIHNHTFINNPDIVIIEGMLLMNILTNIGDLLTESDLLDLKINKEELVDFANNILEKSLSIFVKADENDEIDEKIRLERRVKRDALERGVSEQITRKTWSEKVQPAHLKHVAPQEQLATIIVCSDNFEKDIENIVKAATNRVLKNGTFVEYTDDTKKTVITKKNGTTKKNKDTNRKKPTK